MWTPSLPPLSTFHATYQYCCHVLANHPSFLLSTDVLCERPLKGQRGTFRFRRAVHFPRFLTHSLQNDQRRRRQIKPQSIRITQGLLAAPSIIPSALQRRRSSSSQSNIRSDARDSAFPFPVVIAVIKCSRPCCISPHKRSEYACISVG